jgi:CheY-like chemotaxis protein
LAIVRHIIELHGGSVQAQSEGERQGATFTVELPTLSDTGTVAAATPHPGEGLAPPRLAPLTGVRLLVVDDDADARELLGMVLQEAGADVTTAGSASEALAAFERQRPDVLVSDIGMPDCDGYSMIRKVRSLEGERGARIPAIALTAFARAEDRGEALEAGFQAHLAKPIEPGELTTLIAQLIG